jgi:DNA-binding transcriptional regulator YiaG
VRYPPFQLTNETAIEARYHYRTCGLDGIYLLNGFHVETHDDETYVAIEDVDGLHREIGYYLVFNRKALTPQEIRFLRKTMAFTQTELAASLGMTGQSVARWEKGEVEIPATAEKLLRVLFLALLRVGDEGGEAVRALLISRGQDLERLDEERRTPAQFTLLEKWSEAACA